MSLLNYLMSTKTWNEYFEYKSFGKLTKKEASELAFYIENKKYEDISKKIIAGEYTFNYPQKVLISKMGKSKKRVVYIYNEDEVMILKMITYLLYKYDYLFSPNCYSFRKNKTVKDAIFKLTRTKNICNMYGYKVDINNYFNSINVEKLIPRLKEEIIDKDVYLLLEEILSNKKVIFRNEIIEEEKGIMAGTPTASFLANFYLKDMDEYFFKNKITYIRYSDDIIVFAEDKEKLDECVSIIKEFLRKFDLTINEEKEYYIEPNSRWEFLGFSYFNGIIDVSDNAKKKIKGKIRRSARAVRRWMLRKNVPLNTAISFMIKKFNKKFFFKDEVNELNWARWFFPVVNVSDGLHEIDVYLQENLRYIASGKHNKKNFEKVNYELLKECGYRSLVHEYYEEKNNKI